MVPTPTARSWRRSPQSRNDGRIAARAASIAANKLATRARTSRPSAYEHGRASPTLETAAWLLAAAGQELTAMPQVKFVERAPSRGRTTLVPTSLPRLPLRQAAATITLPLHLNWSRPNREFELTERDRPVRGPCAITAQTVRKCRVRGRAAPAQSHLASGKRGRGWRAPLGRRAPPAR